MKRTTSEGVEAPRALAVPAACLAASVLLRAAFWFQRAFNHDDFYFAYVAWLRSTAMRPSIDYYVPSFMPLAELSAPMFRVLPLPFGGLDAARAVVLIVSIILLFLVYKIARHLGSSTMWAITAAVIASSEPFFTSRIADVRPDTFAAVALLAAILLLLRRDDVPAAVFAGLLAGCAATVSTKVVLSLPLIAIAAALRAPGRRRVMTLIVTGVSEAVLPVAYFAWRLIADGPGVMAAIVGDFRFAAAQESMSTGRFVATIGYVSPLLWIAVIAGGIAGLSKGRTRSMVAYVAFAASFVAILFAADPFLYVYIMLIVTPLLAPFVAGFARAIPNEKWAMTAAAVISVVVTLFSFFSAIRPVHETNVEQRALLDWVMQATSPDEAVFDWQGLHIGRRGTRHWYMFSGLVMRYQNGWYSAADEWKRSQVTLIIDTYRLRWLTAMDRQFLQSHYVKVAPCVIAPGLVVRHGAEPSLADIVVAGDYRIMPPGTEIVVDGHPARDRVRLTAGAHAVSTARNEVALVFTTPRREAAGPPPCPAGPLLFPF